MPLDLQALRARYCGRTACMAGVEWTWIDTEGPGDPVFLIPGGQGTGEMFYKTLLQLGELRRLIAVHYPAEPDGWSLAEGFARLLVHLGIGHLSFVGSSLGAYWGQLFAHRYPERIDQLVIGNTFVDATEVKSLPAFNEREILKASAEETKQLKLQKAAQMPEGELRTVLVDQLARQSAESIVARSLGVARSIVVPELRIDPGQICVLDCTDDNVITPAMKRRVRERYEQSETVALDTGGHYPAILSADAYAAVLARRLSIPPASLGGRRPAA